jgi:hypothetical protein
VAGFTSALVNVTDFSNLPPRVLADGEAFSTGKYRVRYCATPHLPHGWDAGVFFEETQRTLLCSDLFHHEGDVEPLTSSDILGRVRQALSTFQTGPMPQYVPYTANTGRLLRGLSELRPSTFAVMHGSSFTGDGRQALLDLAVVMREVLGEEGGRSSEVAA